MELLDRYLHAVRFWLPKAQQNDIIAELRDDLSSQIEDRESALGRSLTEDELVALLQQSGHPMRVAGRYLPQQSLIGPALFPLYKFVLKCVTFGYLTPWLVVWSVLQIFVPSYRLEHSLLGTWSTFWTLAFSFFGVITLVFAALERFQKQISPLNKWDPRKLPAAVQQKDRVPRVESVFELVFSILFLVGWLSVPRIAQEVFAEAGRYLAVNPALHAYFWPVLLPTLIGMVQQFINLFRPQWTWLRPATRLLTTAIALSITVSVIKIYPYYTLVPGAVANSAKEAARYANFEFAANQVSWWGLAIFILALCIALAVYAFQCIQLLRKLTGGRSGQASAQISQLL